MAVAAALVLVFAFTAVSYATDLGGFKKTVDSWPAKSDDFDLWKENLWTAEKNVSVSKGKLRMAADFEENQYIGGKLRSKFDVGENVYIKVRARTSDALARLKVFLDLGDDVVVMESIPGLNKTYSSSLLPDAVDRKSVV